MKRNAPLAIASLVALITALIPAPCARAQQLPLEAVATVDGVPISAEEYAARLSLTIFPYRDSKRLRDIVAKQLLYSLIGEKLLAAEARRRGLESDPGFRRSRRLAEEMFVRDKLYRDSVRARVTVSGDDIRWRFEARQREVEYQFLFSVSEGEIRARAALLAKGVSFDTLLVAEQQAGAAGAIPEGERGVRGNVEPELRAAMARLKDGQVSAPVRTPGGWYLLRKRARQTVIAAADEFEKHAPGISNELRREREAEASIAFVRRLWRGRSATLAEQPYRRLGQRLLDNARRHARSDSADVLTPDAELYDTLRAQWASQLADPFARIGADVFSIDDMLSGLAASTFRFTKADLRRFPTLYRAAVQDMLDRWIITQEGYRQGLQNSDAVRKDLAQWTDNGLAQALPDEEWEQFVASDDSLWAAYLRTPALFGGPAEVKILEVLVQDTLALRDIERELRTGASLRALATTRSLREGAAARKGELGYFPVTQYGAIGRRAFAMNRGEVSGAIPVPEGVSYFELLDARLPGVSGCRSFAELRSSLGDAFRKSRIEAGIDQTVRRLASRARIEINDAAVRAVDAVPLQMFTVRFLGFGGRIPAAPGVLPVYESVIRGMGSQGDVMP